MMSGIKQPLFFGEVFYYCTELKTFCFHFCYTGNFKKSLGIGSIKNIQCYIIYVYTYDIYIYVIHLLQIIWWFFKPVHFLSFKNLGILAGR